MRPWELDRLTPADLGALLAGWEWREDQRQHELAWVMTYLVNLQRPRGQTIPYDRLLQELIGPERMAALLRRRMDARER